MLKINYPVSGSAELSKFIDDYKELFKSQSPTMQRDLTKLLNLSKFSKVTVKRVDQILTMDFENLIKLSRSFLSCGPSKNELKEVSRIFNYDGKGRTSRQKTIAKFFVKNQNKLNIQTCYFCNLEYINPFVDVADYFDAKDFIHSAPKEELAKIYWLNKDDANAIIRLRSICNDSNDLLKEVERTLDKTKFTHLDNMNFNDSKYYFTLDHVIDKGKNPITALSLFNLVPSCYSCNSKFKGRHKLIGSLKDAELSPTCKQFDFHAKNKFVVGFSHPTVNFSKIRKISDFTLKLDIPNKSKSYGKYEKIFKLNARYKNHKEDVLDLIIKKEKYPRSHIQTIARLTGTSCDEVKRSIFGGELTLPPSELNRKPKAKLKIDVARQLKI